MLLKGSVIVETKALDFSFDVGSGQYQLIVSGGCRTDREFHLTTKPGKMISALAPFRANTEVKALTSWLATQCKIPAIFG